MVAGSRLAQHQLGLVARENQEVSRLAPNAEHLEPDLLDLVVDRGWQLANQEDCCLGKDPYRLHRALT